MSKIAEYKEAREKMQQRLNSVSAQLEILAREQANLQRAINGWDAVLTIEEETNRADREMNLPLPLQAEVTPPVKEAQVAQHKHEDDEEGSENKTQFVRDRIGDRGAIGTTPQDLKRLAKEAGMRHVASWPYSAIMRLKTRGEIFKRRGKLYPASKAKDGSALALVG